NAAGTYTVSLTVTGPGGSDTATQVGYITVSDAPPVANFTGTPTSGAAPLAVNFTDSSTGTVTSWAWDFGDATTSTLQNPSHTYSSVGTYTVSLTVTGPGGSDTLTRTGYITVSDVPPTANFSGSPTAGAAPLAVNFTDSSTGSVTSWSWDFGDGATSTVQNPSHTYTAVGTYSVTLTVSGPAGSDTLTRTNYISVGEPAPVAGFTGTPTSGVAPLAVNFTDSSTGSITSWAWDFGDGGTSTQQNPSYTYNAAGTYTVSLTVTGPGGSDTLTRTGYISVSEPAPVANFSANPVTGVAPLAVNFTDSSTGSVTSWAWDFGDGGTSTQQNPSYTYSAAGTYTVSLTVTGPGGSDTLTKAGYITVGDPPPVADFSGTPTSGTEPLTVAFTDLSSGPVTTWSWDFGDGATSTAQNPSHVYAAAGSYTVSLTVTGPGGSDTVTKANYITVNPVSSGPTYYFSFLTNTVVPGIGTVNDDDIVSYDPATGTWALYFDGADVGIQSTDINAFHVRADGSILMSFNSSSFSVPGLTGGPNGTTVEDSDIILFTPTQTGPNTAGSFSFYFDGSDVGLTTNGEDIDGIYEAADGSLRISTLGAFKQGGKTWRDEDVVQFVPSSLGSNTAGTWSLYFDGSDIGFNASGAYDLDGVTFDGNGDLLFTTLGTYTSGSTVGDDEDVSRFAGSFGSQTSGTVSLELDLSALGIAAGEDMDSLSIAP
ncbi:MAG TPA: PKD domain-containing protein, partial [Planctomycetes bacterium]|nr:PKD domain-containing protein [Planctomycetota bacterium]